MNTVIRPAGGWLKPPTAEESILARRTHAAADVLNALRDSDSGLERLPGTLKRALEVKAWEGFETPLGTLKRHRMIEEWIEANPPSGLGTTVEHLRELIRGDDEALLAFDRATRRPAGNAAGVNQHTAGTLYNVQDSSPPPPQELKAPTGNSAQAVIRRLDKASAAGDELAKLLLDDVLKDRASANAAAHKMGWRKKPTPIQDAMRAWQKMSAPDQEYFLEWASKNMKSVVD